ncbi:MAG: response regulator transcription factor, partial [Anaerolineae bacterium]|nr:response regulator transcription factor [Anaerolineae bacterium]
FQVIEANDGREALFAARQGKPDLIILDLMMPEMSGYEFMRVFSKEADIPIIILTARIEENDRVLGLELGADDYITKPFSMRELAARVRAVLRRVSKGTVQSNVIHAGGIILDLAGHSVKMNDQFVDLTPTEFELLAVLMVTPGRAFSRAELLDRVQNGLVVDGFERTIDAHIHNLRNKIEPDPGQPHYIETIYGVGYRFRAEN